MHTARKKNTPQRLAISPGIATLCCLVTVLVACGGGSGGGGSSAEPASYNGFLKPVQDEAEFLAGLESAYTSQSDRQNRDRANVMTAQEGSPSADFGDTASDGDSGGGGYSTTYTQEVDVDEVDVVKYDGEYLYIVPSLQYNCCYLFSVTDDGDTATSAEVLPPEPQPASTAAIRILATDSNDATAEEVATIPLQEGEYVQGLYLVEDQDALLTLGTQNYYGGYGGYWLDFAPWQQQEMRVNYFDVSDPASPALAWTIQVEGGFVESRRIGDTVYLVSRHTPTVDNLVLYPSKEADFAQNREVLRTVSSNDIIPRLQVQQVGQPAQSRPLFTAQDCLITNQAVLNNERAGYPVLTSITAISLSDPLNPQTVCYNESAAGLYMSSSALYLMDVRYAQEGSTTRIHKFLLGDGKPQYRGSADVEGYVWTGGQRDFRLSEFNGLLRILTTERTDNPEDVWDHRLYILKEADSGDALEQVAQLPNAARPQAIGKANENLFGVRFMGVRAYAVTFEQIDPLYVIDLSNPEDPYIAGSLEIPGFSDFLHPIGDDLLLGLGTSEQWNGQVKLELFDVSNPAAPSSRGATLIGEPGDWNWSEAQYNRHAFTYLAGEGQEEDRLAIPVQRSGSDEQGGYFSEEALHLFEISNKSVPAAASLDQVGRIVAGWEENPNWYGGYRHRSVLHDDAVYFISGDFVWSALWGSPDNVTGPQ